MCFTEPPEDIYLEYNAWLEWLADQGIDPTQFSSKPIHVRGSHRISFPQFCRRFERKLDDVTGFRSMLGKIE